MTIFVYIFAPVLYFLIGGLWAYLRWTNYVRREIEYYDYAKKRFLDFYSIRGSEAEIPPYARASWRENIQQNPRLKVFPPSLENSRNELTGIVLLWPLVILVQGLISIFGIVKASVIITFKTVDKSKIEQIKKEML